ncbi:uncharacterized protein LOC111613369 [Centruroides sculpturatus]|uniref:uncharacterized protein LOC111613369 n=1 Tax=Centruroides sculpturatus TaxID=218467 RepID=UPI000C6DCEF3|nr:uncharacterized protein LOC111613369 [Centruroides sculpturatus]
MAESEVEVDLIENFMEEAFLMVEEVKNYIIENPNGRLSTIDHKRFMIEQMTKIIYLAEENLRELRDKSNLNIKEQQNHMGITKQEVSEIISKQNEEIVLAINEIKQEINEIKKLKEEDKQDITEEQNFKTEIAEIMKENVTKTMEAISTIKGELKTINQTSTQCSNTQEEQKRRYSDVLKLGNRQPGITLPPPSPQYTVLVYSKDKNNNSKQTKEILMKNVTPKDLRIGIKGVREINNGGVAVDLSSTQETAALTDFLTQVKELNTKERRRQPLIKILSVPKSIDKSELIEMLYEQNSCFSEQMSQSILEEEIQIRFLIPQKDSNLQSWVMEVSPMMREIIIREEKLYIGWNRCPVLDYILIRRCYKCLAFGHYAKECQHHSQVCSHCGGGHVYKDCDKEGPAKCTNCYKNKIKDYHHNTIDKDCPCFIKELHKYTRQIN